MHSNPLRGGTAYELGDSLRRPGAGSPGLAERESQSVPGIYIAGQVTSTHGGCPGKRHTGYVGRSEEASSAQWRSSMNKVTLGNNPRTPTMSFAGDSQACHKRDGLARVNLDDRAVELDARHPKNKYHPSRDI